MGYSISLVESFGSPFEVVHEQMVIFPSQGFVPVRNSVRKLIIVLSGECRHNVVGLTAPHSDVLLRAGDILCVPYRCEQRYYGSEPGKAGRLHVVRLSFDPKLLPALDMTSLASHVVKPFPRLTQYQNDIKSVTDNCIQKLNYLPGGALDAVFQETLTHLRDEAHRRLPEYCLRVHELCSSLVILYARKCLQIMPTAAMNAAQAADYHVQEIKKYLRANYSCTLRLKEIAAHVCLSEEHAVRVFRKVAGMTMTEYGRRARIAEAKSLLTNTDKNIGEIAQMMGYASLTVFSRNFKIEEGVTPREFRQQIAREMG